MLGKSKILIIHPGGIGDVVIFTPAIKVLKDTFPEATVDVFIGYTPIAAEILRGSKLINKIFDYNFPKTNFFKKISYIFKLRKEKYDLVIVASGVSPLKGSLLALLIGAKTRIGEYRGSKLTFYTHQVKLNGNQHKVRANLRLLEFIDIKIGSAPLPFFITGDSDKQFAKEFILENILQNKMLIGFAPGVGVKQQFKGWAKENFIDLGKKILSAYPNSFILIFGSSGEKELCVEIKNELKIGALEMVGYPLKQVAVLINHCKVFIASDCGLGHIAATTSTNLFSIFGPTISERTGPIGPKVHIIREKCNYRYHDIFTPKYDINKQHQCLAKINPDRVFNKVKEILYK